MAQSCLVVYSDKLTGTGVSVEIDPQVELGRLSEWKERTVHEIYYDSPSATELPEFIFEIDTIPFLKVHVSRMPEHQVKQLLSGPISHLVLKVIHLADIKADTGTCVSSFVLESALVRLVDLSMASKLVYAEFSGCSSLRNISLNESIEHIVILNSGYLREDKIRVWIKEHPSGSRLLKTLDVRSSRFLMERTSKNTYVEELTLDLFSWKMLNDTMGADEYWGIKQLYIASEKSACVAEILNEVKVAQHSLVEYERLYLWIK